MTSSDDPRHPNLRSLPLTSEAAPVEQTRTAMGGGLVLGVVLILLALAAVGGWGADWSNGWLGENRTAATDVVVSDTTTQNAAGSKAASTVNPFATQANKSAH